MSWGYLGEFWNAVAEVVVDANTYTIAWFQSLGNAVAGAIGSLFEDLIHHIYDVFYIAQYLLDNLADLFSIIFIPLTWIFNFVRGFFNSAFATPPEAGISWVFSDSILNFYNSIPYWNYLMFGVGAGIGILFLVFIFKRIVSI